MNSKDIFELYQELGSYTATAKVVGCDPRTVKRRVNEWHEGNSFAAKEATRTGIPFEKVSHYWLKTKNEEGDDVSMFVKNKHEVMEYEEIRNALLDDLKDFAPRVNPIVYEDQNVERKHLLVIDPADIHIGKLALTDETGSPEYNTDIAFERVLHGVMDILSKATPFGIAQIAIVVGNDILHIDNQKRTTTGGTPQDTDGQWWSMFEKARNLYVNIIEMSKGHAPVTLVFCPSNHDRTLGFGITDSLYSWYRNDANVTLTEYGKSMRHRKYIRFGENLIGFTHGDGAKAKDLTSLMQYEAREDWSKAKYSYWYVHHLHHKFRIVNSVEVEKDYTGVTVIGNFGGRNPLSTTTIECIRSPSEADSWHAINGYVNQCAIEAFIHHPNYGQVARLTSYC